jgi:hypothetical protein
MLTSGARVPARIDSDIETKADFLGQREESVSVVFGCEDVCLPSGMEDCKCIRLILRVRMRSMHARLLYE